MMTSFVFDSEKISWSVTKLRLLFFLSFKYDMRIFRMAKNICTSFFLNFFFVFFLKNSFYF